MKANRILHSAWVLSLGVLLFTSCSKKEDEDNDYSAANDNALAEGAFSEIESIADQGIEGSLTTYKGELQTTVLGHCATLTHDTASSPRTLTVDFGVSNCLCHDGRYRRGKVIVSYQGAYRDSGSTHTITTSGYFVNDHEVRGTKTVTNMGRNSSGNLYYNISVNGTILPAGGGTISWKSDRVREWIAGEGTYLNWLDDVYLITGTASGTGVNGHSYTAATTSPLRVEIGCRWIVSGSFDLTPDGKEPLHADYGSGACDNLATVVFRGKTYQVTLR